MKPLVAVPTYHLAPRRVGGWTTGGFGVPENYVHALRRAGVVPVLVPGPLDEDPVDFLGRFDGLLLAGGGDVEPSRYGGGEHPTIYGVDPDRDSIEFDLALAADRAGMPTLAVCRGLQVLNVAFGGTLAQHLPDVGGLLTHGLPVELSSAFHSVRVAPGSRLAKACGTEIPDCLSHHHQGVARLADGLEPVAWSDDGLVEAVERPGGWVVGVQWHPEMTAGQDPLQQAIFDAFAEALA